MAFVPILGFAVNSTGAITPSATLLPLPAASIAIIDAALGPGDFTIFSINNNVGFEYIQCTGVSGNNAVIVRGTEGTTALSFGAGATVRFLWTTVGILGVTNGGAGVPINVTGSDAAAVTGGPYNFDVNVPFTTITAGTGNVTIDGTYPDFTISVDDPITPGVTNITASGSAVATPITGGFNIDVPVGSLTADPGISITGTWPDFTIGNTQTPGGTGTVTVVTALDGSLTVTSTPTITPDISITPTGVVPGTYGGLDINANGQITAVSGSLLTGVASSSGALTVTGPVAGVVTLGLNDATTSDKGIVKLATPDASGSTDPGDTTSAVVPAGVAAALATVSTLQQAGSGTLNALAPASYTYTVPGISQNLVLAAGQSALLFGYVEVYDTVTPTNIPAFGFAFFNAAALVVGNSNLVNGGARQLFYKLDGPFSGAITLVTTTLGVNEVVDSSYLNVIYNG